MWGGGRSVAPVRDGLVGGVKMVERCEGWITPPTPFPSCSVIDLVGVTNDVISASCGIM